MGASRRGPSERITRPSRGLYREEASAYCGLSDEAFDAQVDANLLPKPLHFVGRRKVWDIRAIDKALDAMSGLASDGRIEDRKADSLRKLQARL